MFRHLASLLALGLLASTAAAARIDSRAFQYALDLPLPEDGAADELYALTLPDSLFAVTLDSLADVRITGQDSQAVPFDITRRIDLAAVTQRVGVAFNRTGFSQPAGANRIEIVYEQPGRIVAPHGLTLRTPLRNFEKSVTVDGSHDGVSWSNILENGVVFDASRFMDVARRELALPPRAYRYFRVVLHDVTDLQSSPVSEIARYAGRAESGEPQTTDRQSALQNRDFRIDGLDFWRIDVAESAARQRIVTHAVSNLTVRSDEKRQQTVVTFESGRVPATELVVETGSRNFSRAVTFYALYPNRRLDQAKPVLARGTLRRIAFRTLSETQLTLAFPETRAPAYELVIENGDNPELAIGSIALRGPQLQALFFASAPGSLRLLAGNERSEAPRFDLSAIRLALDRGLRGRPLQPPGSLAPNPDYARGGGFAFNRKGALAGALVGMVLVLGYALFKATRRFEQSGG
jgi:hypothetical protein